MHLFTKILGFPLIILSIFSFCSFSQEIKPNNYLLNTKKSIDKIIIDGVLNEKAWENAAIADKFYLNRPYDSSFAKLQTEVKVTFDDKNLYIAAKCYQPKNSYVTASLKRDFLGSTSDVFNIILNPFNDKLNGFQFAVNPFNIQREGLISLGEEVSVFWDNIWYSSVKNFDEYWVVEVAIPFKSIRYKVGEGINTWELNFGRNVLSKNEISTWRPVPRNFSPNNLAYTGQLVWETPPPSAGINISLIPFVSAGLGSNFARNSETLQVENKTNTTTQGIGMDAKIAITPSLNLDVTLNPDFSQVEVDAQQTNLSRFELFFPERRQFFLENNDLFGTFGFPDTRPFFSRRIGIAYNPSTGQNNQVGILGGARLSGKLTNDLRIGLMNLQTKKIDFGNSNVLPSANYTVATLQQKIFARSTIGGIFVNKFNDLTSLDINQKEKYNKKNSLGGLEFNYNSKDSRVQTETYFHQTFGSKVGNDATSIAQYIGYQTPNLNANLGLMRIGKDFDPSVGFVPRNGIYQLYRPLKVTFNPKNAAIAKYINAYSLNMYRTYDVYDLKGKPLEHVNNLYLGLENAAGANLYIGYEFTYTYLFDSFDPTNAEFSPNPDKKKNIIPLPVGAYRYNYFSMVFESSQRKNVFGEFSINSGEYFNGNSTNIDGLISFRFQPLGIVSLALNYTDISLPKPYNSVKYWLVGPKAEFSFSKSVFFSNFFQYNTQTNNFNINSRLQWRFKPVSDLFLVYTDNRFATNISQYNVRSFEPKNRALVFKLTYWFNV